MIGLKCNGSLWYQPKALALVAAAALMAAPFQGWAQSNDDSDIEQAREALRPKEDDPDRQRRLREILDRNEARYELNEQGESSFYYRAEYYYYEDAVQGDAFSSLNSADGGSNRLTDIQQDAQHVLVNSLRSEFGLTDNVTLGLVLPLVAKWDAINERSVADLGDVSLEGQWQPWPSRLGETTWTLYSRVTAPTGESPFDVELGEDLSTGQGYWSGTLGFNARRVIDPVVAFGGLAYTYNAPAEDLSQRRGRVTTGTALDCSAWPPLLRDLCGQLPAEQPVDLLLREVKPSDSVQLSLGLAYALSYDVSLSFNYQQVFFGKSELVFEDLGTLETESQAPSFFVITTGWRLQGERVMNVSVGLGQSTDAPDSFLMVDVPF